MSGAGTEASRVPVVEHLWAQRARTKCVLRSGGQKMLDLLTFPLRAFTIFEHDRWGLRSLRSERYDYVARHVRGRCLDVGCGRHDLFIRKYCGNRGKGIDVFAYDGLTAENLVADITHFPFDDESFDTITFIACINHVPRHQRDLELAEAYRCLRRGGNIVVTMGNPLAEVAVHRVISAHDKLFGTNFDVDAERGMKEGESLYITRREIYARLARAGFTDFAREPFWTQWGLNSLYVGWKR